MTNTTETTAPAAPTAALPDADVARVVEATLGDLPLLTLRSAAALLQVHPQTVLSLVRRGELKAIQFAGTPSKMRFRPRALTAYLARVEK